MASHSVLIWGAVLICVMSYVAIGFSTMPDWERQPIFFLGGSYAWTAGPGLTWVPPWIYQRQTKVSVQNEARTVEDLHARTKDNIPLLFDITVVSRIPPDRVRDAVVLIKNGRFSVDELAKPAAVENVGKTDFEHIQGEEGKFAENVLASLRTKVAPWGIEVSQVGISNIRITDESIAESIAKKPRAVQDALAEQTLLKALQPIAASYGVSTFQLRQLVAVNAMGANGRAIVVPSDMGDVMRKIPPGAHIPILPASDELTAGS